MKRLGLLLCWTAAAAALEAKAPVSKIVIRGGNLPAAIEISGQEARAFNIWSGAGTFRDGVEATEGFVCDWRSGPVAVPTGEPRYQILFHTRFDNGPEKLAYVVEFAAGRVLLPGPDTEWYKLNTWSISRGGREGKWFGANAGFKEFMGRMLRPAQAR